MTHGGVLRGMFTLAAGGDLRRHSPFWADNCSISVLDFYHGAVVVRLFNDTGHLAGPLKLGRNQLRDRLQPAHTASRFLTHDTCRDMI